MKTTISGKIFDVFNYVFLSILIVLMLYPCLYVLFASVSDPLLFQSGSKIFIMPRGFGLAGYESVFDNRMIWTGYRNTIFYVLTGTTISVALTTMGAYVLSRKYLPFRNQILLLIIFTMYFGGGMIPKFLVVRSLGMLDTVFAIILTNAVVTYNLIITLAFFRNMPNELEEAAKIDGANDYQTLFRIMIPLAKPIVAVITLYYAVAEWNSFMPALLYLHKRTMMPLQLILREILIQNDNPAISVASDADAYAENVRYAMVVVSTVPILCVYPFLQKYFVKGVMIGAIKG